MIFICLPALANEWFEGSMGAMSALKAFYFLAWAVIEPFPELSIRPLVKIASS